MTFLLGFYCSSILETGHWECFGLIEFDMLISEMDVWMEIKLFCFIFVDCFCKRAD